MTGIEVARRLGNSCSDPVPSKGKAMTVSITPLTSVFAGEVGPIDLRKVHDRETLEFHAPFVRSKVIKSSFDVDTVNH